MNFNKIHIYFNKRESSHKTQKLNTANIFQIYEFSEKNQDNQILKVLIDITR